MRKLTLLCVVIAAGMILCQACGAQYYSLSDEDHGGLTFVNTTNHSVTVYVDGSRKGTVYGNTNKTWWVGTGSHTVYWESSYGTGYETVNCTDGAVLLLQ